MFPVLARVCIAMTKHHDQKQLQEKSVYLNLHPLVPHPGKSEQELKSGTWRQELMLRPWRSTAYWLVLASCSAHILWLPRPRDWVLHQFAIKKHPEEMSIGQTAGARLSLRFPLPTSVKLTTKFNHHTNVSRIAQHSILYFSCSFYPCFQPV